MTCAGLFGILFSICLITPFTQCQWIGGWGGSPMVAGGFGMRGGFYHPPPPPPLPLTSFLGPPPLPPPIFAPLPPLPPIFGPPPPPIFGPSQPPIFGPPPPSFFGPPTLPVFPF